MSSRVAILAGGRIAMDEPAAGLSTRELSERYAEAVTRRPPAGAGEIA